MKCIKKKNPYIFQNDIIIFISYCILCPVKRDMSLPLKAPNQLGSCLKVILLIANLTSCQVPTQVTRPLPHPDIWLL